MATRFRIVNTFHSNEELIRAFRKETTRTGVVSKCKERQFFESNSEKKRAKRRNKKNEIKKKLREHFGNGL